MGNVMRANYAFLNLYTTFEIKLAHMNWTVKCISVPIAYFRNLNLDGSGWKMDDWMQRLMDERTERF